MDTKMDQEMEYITGELVKVTMEEEDIDMYSSPYDNYLRLLQTIEAIESGARLTEDWFEEHKQHIRKYRETFPNFRKVNEEVEDAEFRKNANETETILANLIHEIEARNMFTVKLYLILNKHMKQLCEFIYGEEELLDMIGRMSL